MYKQKKIDLFSFDGSPSAGNGKEGSDGRTASLQKTFKIRTRRRKALLPVKRSISGLST